MPTLEDLLAAEEELFRREELILRQFAIHVRGLKREHIEPLVAGHLRDCAKYFATHGTIDGPRSPWKTGNREDV